MTTRRQQILVLYLSTSALDSRVVGWSWYDGTGHRGPETGEEVDPPYDSGLAAMLDGWRLLQASQLLPPCPSGEHDLSYLKHEFFFEKLVDIEHSGDSVR